MKKILVSVEPLRQLLEALIGPSYLIHELQATTHIDAENPITLLIGEYKAALENQNDRSNNRKMAGIELPPAPPMIEDLSGSISFDDEWEDQSLGT